MEPLEAVDWGIEILLLILSIGLGVTTIVIPELQTKEFFYLGFSFIIGGITMAAFSYVIGNQRKQNYLIKCLLEKQKEEL
jgi:hypothetical protein